MAELNTNEKALKIIEKLKDKEKIYYSQLVTVYYESNEDAHISKISEECEKENII